MCVLRCVTVCVTERLIEREESKLTRSWKHTHTHTLNHNRIYRTLTHTSRCCACVCEIGALKVAGDRQIGRQTELRERKKDRERERESYESYESATRAAPAVGGGEGK